MHQNMITVGGYYPAEGKNTIRKASDKYQHLLPGDDVTMTYCDTVDDEGEPVGVHAIEDLVVSSISRASFDAICKHHLLDNHAVTGGDIGSRSREEVERHLIELYKLDTYAEEQQFLAIYFA